VNRQTTAISTRKAALGFSEQGANVLLAATCEFLRRNNIKKKQILDVVRSSRTLNRSDAGFRQYKERVHAYEHMGLIMGTWFSNPRFLDEAGKPLPITQSRGRISLANLIRASGTKIDVSVALELMRQSPSIQFYSDGTLCALKRVFVIPRLDVPRAAFVIERYLNTLQQNADGRKKASVLLLERSCHVSQVDLKKIAPILRDIESRGTAFMDSIDGEIEDRRLRKTKRKNVGELGVLVFAWTRPPKSAGQKKKSTIRTTKPTRSLSRLPPTAIKVGQSGKPVHRK
jgi:hypothetical protein